MKIRSVVVTAALLATASGAAMAQMGQPDWNKMPEGAYISGFGGANWARDRDLSNPTGILGLTSVETEFKTGWVGGGSVGYSFSNGAAIELEGAYRSNKVDKFSNPAIPGALCPVPTGGTFCGGDGRLTQLTIMANFIYNIATGTQFVPQLGVGVGAARVKANDFTASGLSTTTDRVDGSDWGFAAQGIVGLAYYITEQLSLGVRGVYLHTSKAKNLETVAGGVALPDSQLDSGGNLSALAVLKYDFGLRPRIMPAAAPPAIIRNWTVYFDHDKSVITPEGDRVVVQAADHAKRGNVARLTVTGHTDRSGTVQYNQALSQRRADTVTARLVALGIPRNAISVVARGESQPAVPTADGVREPQNRRVEIVLQ